MKSKAIMVTEKGLLIHHASKEQVKLLAESFAKIDAAHGRIEWKVPQWLVEMMDTAQH